MKVAFIGLGIMGSRMARNLLNDPSLTVTVFNRSDEPVRALEKAGAQRADSAAEAVANADVVYTMLASPEVVEEVAFGKQGFVAAMAPNALWVNCSTVNPSFTRYCADRANTAGIRFIDGPVAGTRMPAETGELTFLLGGEAADIDSARSQLEQMGSKILHVGPAGQGSAFKMLVNALLAQSMLAYSETALLGEKLGFSREFLMDTLPELPVSAPFLKGKAQLIRDRDYEAQFPLELMHKDLHLLDLTAYEENQPLFLASLAKAVYGRATAHGRGRDDFAAIYDFLDGQQSG
ncbi:MULTISPECIES: NAD(P)-dependent oxidoreductase [Halomonas]|uniref:3-hydroxyisobutyrate dehydrogenase/glyoxylate/succinic semialdehyde reductase n=1 Tax=Halomonas ventosae TaxID=229007 RepID=A0A4V3C222_9GAMM|nr:NAD(P)-dependent oxidoreductase [Halomonas ventosae]TDO16499.1 3-hydroxyisobutyrate dehydrogenase/glyoxylate/succinic semialdehyde reductase [Halomonas ventosae]